MTLPELTNFSILLQPVLHEKTHNLTAGVLPSSISTSLLNRGLGRLASVWDLRPQRQIYAVLELRAHIGALVVRGRDLGAGGSEVVVDSAPGRIGRAASVQREVEERGRAEACKPIAVVHAAEARLRVGEAHVAVERHAALAAVPCPRNSELQASLAKLNGCS